MNFKYHVGDFVRIRKDLSRNAHVYNMVSGPVPFSTNIATSEMVACAGKVFKVSSIRHGQYRLGEMGYYWVDEMFEPISECVCTSLL